MGLNFASKLTLVFFAVLGAMTIIAFGIAGDFFYYVEQNFKQDKEALSTYIEEKFPNAEYEVIPKESALIGPNYIEIIYKDEPDVSYGYEVYKDHILLLNP